MWLPYLETSQASQTQRAHRTHVCTHTHTHTHPTRSPLFLVNGTSIYSAGQARNLGVILDVPHSLIPQPNIHHLMLLNISWFCLPLSILRCQARSSPALDYSTNLPTDHHQQLPPPSNPFSRQPPKWPLKIKFCFKPFSGFPLGSYFQIYDNKQLCFFCNGEN